MSKNFIEKGEVLQVTASQNIESGSLVVIGNIAGVAISDIAQNETGAVQIYGVFSLTKAALAINQGAKVYWDAVNNNVTTTVATNVQIGVAAKAALLADAAVDVLLNVAN